MRWVFFLFFARILLGADFDCAFIGTSPIPLFEALYQKQLGKSVLILEQDTICGGAWKSISICGVEHVDMGCHQIHSTPQLKEFLETYAGCNILSIGYPKGLYFSKGCYELIHNLTRLISSLGISLLSNHRLESVYVDETQEELILKTEEKTFTVKELFYTRMTPFTIENPPPSIQFSPKKPKYYHIYLLIHDPTPPRFSFKGYGLHGASRAMNLTPFLDLEALGRQLIVFQVHSEQAMRNGPLLFDNLKDKNLISPSALLLQEEPYVYETGAAPQRIPPQWDRYFKILQTSGLLTMIHQIPRWKEILKPFHEIFPE